jgi:hypothetical protein
VLTRSSWSSIRCLPPDALRVLAGAAAEVPVAEEQPLAAS